MAILANVPVRYENALLLESPAPRLHDGSQVTNREGVPQWQVRVLLDAEPVRVRWYAKEILPSPKAFPTPCTLSEVIFRCGTLDSGQVWTSYAATTIRW